MSKSLIIIKKYLLFPNDDDALSNMESVIRELLINEQSFNTRQLIQQVLFCLDCFLYKKLNF